VICARNALRLLLRSRAELRGQRLSIRAPRSIPTAADAKQKPSARHLSIEGDQLCCLEVLSFPAIAVADEVHRRC
jgi:hypothetical protein